ncbi:MAG TPA: hypothetical protein VMR44_04565 [Thermoanaerobaculia bacterium]|nr:hypothetical protein [Thermoanaerobaculia bacterium]
MSRRSRTLGRPLLAAVLLAMLAGALGACRPDPYSLLVRTIRPGRPVELPDGYTLTVTSREGTVLRGVRITGVAKTCRGTLELEAPEVRLEPADASNGPRLVLERPVVEERCGPMKAVTRHDRLIWYLDGAGGPP